MERAAKAVRRSGVKLLSLGGGHGELNMVISEQKDVKNTAKAFMAAQNSASQYLMKWAVNEENRAIQDVGNQIVELNLVWTEAQREFTDHLKDFKQMYEFVLEGEKHVDQAKNALLACEQRENKIKKELKKAAKQRLPADEFRVLENRLMQAERQKDLAQLEVEDRIRENEAVKLIRFKDGLARLSEAYVELGRKCAIIFEAQRDIATQLPDVYERDLEEIKYTGSGATKQYVMQAKEKVRQYKRHRQSGVAIPNTGEPPPPYTPGNFYIKHPPGVKCVVNDTPTDNPPLSHPDHTLPGYRSNRSTTHSNMTMRRPAVTQPQHQPQQQQQQQSQQQQHQPQQQQPQQQPDLRNPTLQPREPPPLPQPPPLRQHQYPIIDLVAEDREWGSEDELENDMDLDLTGAMGGMKL